MIRLALIALTGFVLANPASQVGAQPPTPKRRALLVGISTYQKQGLADKPLPFAATDMEVLEGELKKFDWQVKLLKSKGAVNTATLKHIREALDETLAGINADDLVLIAFSGHGQQFLAKLPGMSEPQEEAFFCPSDGSPGDAATLFGMTELVDRLAKKGGKNLVLIDACRDDPRRGGGKGVEGNTARNVPQNTAILFSCAARQQSFETNLMFEKGSRDGRGVFFNRVLKGLQGDAKNERDEVSWDRLVEYVKEKVNEDAVRWFPERVFVNASGEQIVQTPHMVGSLVGKSPVLLKVAAGTTVSSKSSPGGNPNPRMPAAERVFSRGLYQLLTQRGRGENDEAFRWFTQSGKMDYAPGAYWSAVMFTYGYDVAKIDDKSALAWLQQSANAGYAPAEAMLGRWTIQGRGGLKRDENEGRMLIEKAVPKLKEMVAQSDVAALNSLGEMLALGFSYVQKDPVEGLRLLRLAADRGDALAQLNLGRALEISSVGITRDLSESLKWVKKSADQGNAFAQVLMGSKYLHAIGVERNPTESTKWYAKGADQGYASAQYLLSAAYETGRGVQPDRAKAIELLQRAANQGYGAAQTALDRLKASPSGNPSSPSIFAVSPDRKSHIEAVGVELKHFTNKVHTWSNKHPDRIVTASYSPTGKRVATACIDGKVRLFDAQTGQRTQEFDFAADELKFDKDGVLSGKGKSGTRSWKVR